jgi:crotonobetainyl-CoA:carnitine CoA-transferase CaiB-like acyl-CoA transferase
MTSPREALAHVWERLGGAPAALARVHLTGAEPVLPSSFRTGTLAQATIAAAALAASEVDRVRHGRAQAVRVDMHHAAAEFISERLYTVDGRPPGETWDKIAGTYRVGDGRWVRLHTNFPHHRAGILDMLGVPYEREAVAAALQTWRGQDYEDEVARRGLVGTMMRSPAEWAAHPQGQAVAELPLLEIIKIADAPTQALPPGPRPLSSVRVLDLTRVLAGPRLRADAGRARRRCPAGDRPTFAGHSNPGYRYGARQALHPHRFAPERGPSHAGAPGALG